MRGALEKARFVVLIGVVFGMLASLVAFGWGGYRTILLMLELVRGHSSSPLMAFVQVMDAFLIAAGLVIFALGLYELFVGHLTLPDWLVIPDFDALKSKLASIMVLVLAGSFLERVEGAHDATSLLYSGTAIALVSATLIWFMRISRHRAD